MKGSRFNICTLFLVCGCSTEFDSPLFEGTWKTVNLRFSGDNCGIQNAMETSIEQQNYTFGTLSEDNGNDNDNGYIEENGITQNVLDRAGSNLWEICDSNNDPTFDCPLPLPILSFDAWKSGLDDFINTMQENSNYELCTESFTAANVEGWTEGLFVDERNAFYTSMIRISCSQSELNEMENSCESTIAGDLQR